MLEPVIERYREWLIDKFFRGDARFAFPELYEFLEDEAFCYAIRLKSDQVLERHIEHLLTRPEIEAKVVRHARYTCFQMAEVLLKRSLFATILSPKKALRDFQNFYSVAIYDIK